MCANPIIRRYRFSQLRPQQVWVFGALYVCVALLILFINSSIYRYGEGAYTTLTELYKGLFVQFAILEVFMLWLLCPANCSNVVAREIADKSFDFFRMLPIRAGQKAVGILVGRNLLCLIIATVNLGLCLAFGFAGGIPAALMPQMMAVLASVTAALNLVSLLFSVLSYKKSKAHSSIPLVLIVGLFTFGPLMGMMRTTVGGGQIETYPAFFYGAAMPVLYLVSCCTLFVAAWAYIGLLRRFTREYEALFSRVGAGLFMLTFMVVLCGLFYVYLLGPDGHRIVWGVWLSGLLLVGIVPLFAIRSFDRYLEISRTAHRATGLFWRLLVNSNIVGGLVLFVIWLVFAIAAGLTAKADRVDFLWLSIITFSALLVILALIETYALWQPRNDKIGYLLGFLAILYCVLPFILGAIFENETLFLFSPLGIVGILDGGYDATVLLMPLFFNLICLLPLGILIGKRYYDLVCIRTQIGSLAAHGADPSSVPLN